LFGPGGGRIREGGELAGAIDGLRAGERGTIYLHMLRVAALGRQLDSETDATIGISEVMNKGVFGISKLLDLD
jgi:hypothetical protein